MYRVPIVNGRGRVNPVSGDIMTPRNLTHFRMLVHLLTGSKMLSVKCLGVAFHFLLNFLACFMRWERCELSNFSLLFSHILYKHNASQGMSPAQRPRCWSFLPVLHSDSAHSKSNLHPSSKQSLIISGQMSWLLGPEHLFPLHSLYELPYNMKLFHPS